MRAVRAVVFDFNGTLSDDEPLMFEIYRGLFAEQGRPLSREQYFSELAGHSEEAIIGGWLGVGGDELDALVAERIARYTALAADGSTVPDRAREPRALRGGARARGGRLGRIPRRDRARARRGGNRRMLSLPRHGGRRRRAASRRPTRTQRRSRRLGDARPADVVAIEDTEAGVASAKAAGLHCVAVLGTHPRERLADADEIADAARRRARPAAAPVTLVIAHRGASWHERENTLPAFERAIREGADFVELDVQASQDGALVVFHDLELDRLTPLRGPLRRRPLAELREVGSPRSRRCSS